MGLYLQSSLRMSIIIIGILIFLKAMGGEYTSRLRYYIWLPVIIALIIPINITLPDNTVKDRIIIVNQIANVKDTVSPSAVENNQMKEVPEDVNRDNLRKYIDNDIVKDIWVIGMCIVAIYRFLAYIIMRYSLQRWSFNICSEDILNSFNYVKVTNKIKKNIDIKECSNINTPMIVGIFKPVLYLPQRIYSDKELYFVLDHELIHYKRQDILYKLGVLLACTIHWFNPLVYIMKIKILTECEISCDERLLKDRDVKDRQFYARLIIEHISNSKTRIYMGSCLHGRKEEMKKRLRAIINCNKKRKGTFISIGVIICIVCISLFVILNGDGKIEAINNGVDKSDHKEDRAIVDKSIIFNTEANLITVAMKYSSYNSETQKTEEFFSEPMKMQNQESIKYVASEFNGEDFTLLTDKERSEVIKLDLTYQIVFYKDDIRKAEILFYGLENIIYNYNQHYYKINLKKKETNEKIMRLITFFKPVHF